MPDETTTTETVKAASDGTVKIAVEKYNELLETITRQKTSIDGLNEQLRQARSQPPVINRTIVEKTPEILAKEYRVWGATCMGSGASLFIIGALLFRTGHKGL